MNTNDVELQGWTIEANTSRFSPDAAIRIFDENGALIHVSRTWMATATHLCLELVGNAALKTDNEQLRGIVAKLRKTDDGVPMVPKEHYWAYCRDRWADDDDPWELLEVVWWQGGGDDCFNPEFMLVDANRDWEFFVLEEDKVYSTREAAEAARSKA